MSREEAVKELTELLPEEFLSEYAEAIRMGIEALKQEPCEDAVRRQAVDDAIYDYSRSCDVNYAQIMEFIDNLPSVTPQPKMGWIPVSERLPEVGSEVLVCFDFKGKRSVYISHFYGDGEFHGLDDEYLTTEGRKYRKAVAWMPLPEPYLPDINVGNMSEIPTGAEGSDKE